MRLQWPIPPDPGAKEPNLGQPFGAHQADYSKLGMIGHNGQDMPYPLGTPVYAAHDGWLTYVNNTDKNIGYAIKQYFEEDGKGYELEYWHFEDTLFPDQPYNLHARFTMVKQGQLIGHVDTTGFSTRNHLHFGLRFVNPNTLEIMNAGNGYKGSVDPLPFLRNKDTSMNKYVTTFLYNGTVYVGVPAAGPDNIPFLNNMFNLNISQNADGSIPVEHSVKDV